jgi:hypothetical protein
MRILLALILTLTSFSTFANCTMKVWVSPEYSQDVLMKTIKIMKSKKYKVLPLLDERIERFRVVVAHPNIRVNGEWKDVVNVYVQYFTNPNYTKVLERTEEYHRANKDDVALSLVREIPACDA